MAVALIIVGCLLIILNILSIKKENKSFSNTLSAKELNIDEFKIEIEKIRSEFTEELAKIQNEVNELKSKVGEDKEYKNNIANEKNSVLVSEVKDMLSEGLTIEEISKKLNMSKGEILLIKELYLK